MIDVAGQLVVQKTFGVLARALEQGEVGQGGNNRGVAGSDEFFGRVTKVGNQAVFTACAVFFEKCLPLIVHFPGFLARERGSGFDAMTRLRFIAAGFRLLYRPS